MRFDIQHDFFITVPKIVCEDDEETEKWESLKTTMSENLKNGQIKPSVKDDDDDDDDDEGDGKEERGMFDKVRKVEEGDLCVRTMCEYEEVGIENRNPCKRRTLYA